MSKLAAASTKATGFFQTIRRFLKKPWEITGPASDPEYRSAIHYPSEFRVRCPATTSLQPIVPTSEPQHVYDIKYFSRDQRRNRPPIKRTILNKADVEKMMKEKTFEIHDFPPVYLTDKVEEDYNAVGGGYQK